MDEKNGQANLSVRFLGVRGQCRDAKFCVSTSVRR